MYQLLSSIHLRRYLFSTVTSDTIPQEQPDAILSAAEKVLEKKERTFDRIREENRRKTYPSVPQEKQKKKPEQNNWRQPTDHKPSGKFGGRWVRHMT